MAVGTPLEPTWTEIAARLVSPRIYWVHTTDPSGAPHASPVWGVVVHDRLFVYTLRSTVKARNLVHDRRSLVHLESGADVVIVHGLLVDQGHPRDAPAVLEVFSQKYDHPDERPFLPQNNADFDVLYALFPHRALLWTLPDSEASMRRWSGAAWA